MTEHRNASEQYNAQACNAYRENAPMPTVRQPHASQTPADLEALNHPPASLPQEGEIHENALQDHATDAMRPENAFHPDERDLKRLYALLEAQIQQYEIARQALTRKREIVVSGNAKGLQQVDRELLSVSHKVVQLEQERQALQQTMGCPPVWTLETLIHQAPPTASRSLLTDARHRLLRVLHDTDQLSRENQDLLTLSLQWIKDTVNVIASAISPEGASYTAQGSKMRRSGTDVPPAPLQSTISHSA